MAGLPQVSGRLRAIAFKFSKMHHYTIIMFVWLIYIKTMDLAFVGSDVIQYRRL